jgi:hypothetical protein
VRRTPRVRLSRPSFVSVSMSMSSILSFGYVLKVKHSGMYIYLTGFITLFSN